MRVQYLYPRIGGQSLPGVAGITLVAALGAGLYGIVHDQITYSLSPEYFTKAKFTQFWYLDMGHSERVFAGVIGFLASWWMGALAGWFLARLIVPRVDMRTAWRTSLAGLAGVLASAVVGFVTGWGIGLNQNPEAPFWRVLCTQYQVTDPPAFITVACVHYGSYAGAVLGLLVALGVTYRALPKTGEDRNS